jgi:hypothetical protein
MIFLVHSIVEPKKLQYSPDYKMIAQNVAEHFNLNSGVRVRVRGSRAEDVSRGSLMDINFF